MKLSDNTEQLLRLPTVSDPLAIILKLVGERCNLDCSYCYEKRKPYAGTRVLEPRFVRDLLLRMGDRHVAIELHGGEPLLYPKSRFEELSLLFSVHDDKISRIRLQTNATLLTEQWLDFLLQMFPKVQFGISADGPSDRSKFRLYYDGRESFELVDSALQMLSERKVSVGVICVVTAANVHHGEELLGYFGKYSAIRVVKFVPCFDVAVTQDRGPLRRREIRDQLISTGLSWMPWSISPSEFTAFLERVWREWKHRNWWKQFLVEPFGSVLKQLSGGIPSDCHFTNEKCAHVLTLYPDGQVGSCDELGKVAAHYDKGEELFDQIDAKWGNSSLDQMTRRLLDKCVACTYRASCGGGCIASRRRFASVGIDEEYCRHRKAMIDMIAAERDRLC